MKKILLTLLMTASASFAADAPFSSLTALGNNLAAGDLFAVTDISDTTQSANGTSKKIVASDVGLYYISDTAYSSAFNAVTDKTVSKNAIYDYLHLGDADDDGKIDVLDLAAAGFPAINSSGALVASRSVAEGAAIDVTNGDGASGNPTVAWDATEAEALTWGAGGNASNVWTFNLSGTDPVLTLSSGVFNVSTGTLQQGGVDVVTISGTQTLTNKTATTESAGDNDTSVATTAFVQTAARDTVTGTHASPSTTTPLSPTWNSVTQVVYYGVTGTINLPAASTYAGRSIIIYNTGAFTVTIDPNSSEVVVRDGTVQTGGVSFTLSTGAGNYVALICDGVRWITLGYKGTLTVGS